MQLIIINGLPGSGKTTIARPLADALGYPLITKDCIKEFLFDTLGIKDRAWSSALGKASAECLYDIADSILAQGQSVVVESAFEAAFAKPRLQQIVDTYHPEVIELYCQVDELTRYTRFVSRNELGNRHTGHCDTENYDTVISQKSSSHKPLNISTVKIVDTTPRITTENLIRMIN